MFANATAVFAILKHCHSSEKSGHCGLPSHTYFNGMQPPPVRHLKLSNEHSHIRSSSPSASKNKSFDQKMEILSSWSPYFITRAVNFPITLPHFGNASLLNGTEKFIIFARIGTIALIGTVRAMFKTIALPQCWQTWSVRAARYFVEIAIPIFCKKETQHDVDSEQWPCELLSRHTTIQFITAIAAVFDFSITN